MVRLLCLIVVCMMLFCSCDNGIVNAVLNENGHLILTMKDGSTLDAGEVKSIPGEQGEKGDKGEPGATGTQGPKGDTGATGATGAQGPQGEKGETGATGATGAAGQDGEDGRGILKTEIIEGYLWITYSDAPDTPVNLGKVVDYYNGTEGLEFYPLSDGTYGVSVGRAKYMEVIRIPEFYNGKEVRVVLAEGFAALPNLLELYVPQSVVTVQDKAFADCTALKTIVFEGESKPESFGESVFLNCNAVESMTVPFAGASLDGAENTHLGYIFGASEYSENENYVPISLKTVVITGGTIIGEYAFSGCSGLTEFTIPASVTSIGYYAFQNCTALARINFAENSQLSSIGNYAFYACIGLREIILPASITSIGERAFYGCSSLAEITIPAGVTSIGSYAFNGCSALTSATFENTSGWKTTNASISSYNLADKSTAATYLKDKYLKYVWTRS